MSKQFNHGRGNGSFGECFQWANNKTCSYGNKCKYKHDSRSAKPTRASPLVSAANKSTDIQRFLMTLKGIKSSQLVQQLKSSMWQQAWTDHDKLTRKHLLLLIESLAKIPGSSDMGPPPILHCKNSAELLLSKTKSEGNKDELMWTGELICNFVHRLLQFEWEEDKNDVQAHIVQILIACEAVLNKSIKEHREVAQKILSIIEDVQKPWCVKQKKAAAVLEANVGSSLEMRIEDWRNATIDWLSNPRFFTPSTLPAMKVKESQNGGVYKSFEEYITTVYKIWIGMTFADGFASLSPICRSRKGKSGEICQQTLWPVACNNAPGLQNTCRTRGCNEIVEYACRTKSHDGLCHRCADLVRQNNRGFSGPHASTHVYDGVVDRADFNGRLFVKSFKSRNPPVHPIHWKSTKRLSSPSLVGVIKLNSHGAALKGPDHIFWGEVLLHGHPKDEAAKRENGLILIGLSTIVEANSELFEPGDSIAIIDCMTFVPEWIPVLRALEQQKSEGSPPFDQNGSYLNLCCEYPANVRNSVAFEQDPMKIYLENRNKLIEDMIDHSMLDPICQIRRKAELKDELLNKLTDLVNQSTLDHMQLISFIDSIRNPVHLTQGPPGTGKSYLGVVLVRAFIIIRNIWMKVNSSVGSHPILVLSYKNHSIDEFLNDLVVSEPSAAFRFGGLIRIGGHCSDPRLQAYCERSLSKFDPEVTSHQRKMECLQSFRDRLQVLLKQSTTFLAFKQEIFPESQNNDDDQKIQKGNSAAYEATTCIVAAIQRIHNIASTDSGKNLSLEMKFQYLEDESGTTFDPCNAAPKLFKDPYQDRFKSLEDAIYLWIRGQTPLPLCQFKTENIMCNEESLSHSPRLCRLHRCNFMANGQMTCTEPVVNSKRFCELHRCQADNCSSSIIGSPQHYCHIHVCKRCIELEIISQMADDEPPKNVCVFHPMCCTPGCLNYSTPDRCYCEEHETMKCQGKTNRGQPCNKKAISKSLPFCQDHRYQMPTFEENLDSGTSLSAEAEQNICIAKTKKKKPCKDFCLPGSRYCYNHAPPQKLQLEKEKNTIVEPALEATPKTTESTNKNVEIDESNNTKEPLNVRSSKLEYEDGVINSDSFLLIGSDMEYFIDSAAASAFDNLDEVDLEYEADNIEHLREVFEVCGDYADEDSNDGLSVASMGDRNLKEKIEAQDQPENSKILHMLGDFSLWTWDMQLEERWDACQALMIRQKMLLMELQSELSSQIIAEKKNIAQAKIRASTKVYENRSVIGGTMVGCISRLEAIRATRPFAILIEEASEVLEPLVFSCICDSTCKLEMIGDHRQLQPSIMSRFEFELVNKVNVSMFQRLIEAPPGHQVPSTVLSIQRRMRKSICDLTRDYYSDITEIKDDNITKTQTIGSREKVNDLMLLNASQVQKQDIPGIKTDIFLWTHCGEQQRSDVGISRVNKKEAQMICSLARYLVLNGVPKKCIVILTPYKGQLMFIRKMLLQDKEYSSAKLLSTDDRVNNVCRLSTVDRFQGDEGDVVLISLVVDKSSKTPFVKKINRMIVLLSRARLGMYIIGNMGYFENVHEISPHWAKTFEMLQQPAINDDSKNALLENGGSFVRVGDSIPLCCPIHHGSLAFAKSASDLKIGFCKMPCEIPLSCSHLCGLLCHWPILKHNNKCQVLLKSPCSIHSMEEITCSEIFRNAPGVPPESDCTVAIANYKCHKLVELHLACTHHKLIPCHEYENITSGKMKPPRCEELSPTPYIYPVCKHVSDVKCFQLEDFTRDPEKAPKCRKNVQFIPKCGHVKSFPCHLYQDYDNGTEFYRCQEKEEFNLLRCGHTAIVSCDEARRLEQWIGTHCQEPGQVLEGTDYGKMDYRCEKDAIFVRLCGHEIATSCNQAFQMAKSRPQCQENVQTVNPQCGHLCQLKCFEWTKIKDIPVPPPATEWVEGSIPPLVVPSSLLVKCNVNVSVRRLCGHVEKVKCSQASSGSLKGCTVIVPSKSPLCGHEVKIVCSKSLAGCKLWSDDVYNNICQNNVIPRNASEQFNMAAYSVLSPSIIAVLSSCTGSRILSLPCSHEVEVGCSQLNLILEGKESIKCNEIRTGELLCKHKIKLPCWKYDAYVKGKLSVSCDEESSACCWNCDKRLSVKCGFNGTVACSHQTRWTCGRKKHSYKINPCAEGVPDHCPDCNLDQQEEEIKKVRDCNYETPSLFNGISPKKVLKMKNIRIERTELELLEKFRDFFQLKPFKKRPLFSLKRIPCYIVLPKQLSADPSKFDISTQVKQVTLHGAEVVELCYDSLKVLHSQARKANYPIKLLVGFASIAHTCVDCSWPQHKEKKSFFTRIQRDGYDSMSYKKDGLSKLLLWEPFAAFFTHCIELHETDFNEISRIDEIQDVDLKPSFIKFDKPGGCLTLSKPFSVLSSKNEIFVNDHQQNNFGKYLNQSKLEGWVINTLMPCDKFGVEGIPNSVEKELLEKMQFCNPNATPFSGKKRLESLKEKIRDPLLDLLMALELIPHDTTTAMGYLNDYLAGSKAADKNLHPWALLAAARLESDKGIYINLLKCFVEFFPDGENHLTEDEREALDSDEKNHLEDTIYSADVVDNARMKWKKLTLEYGASSESMEELLSLTGLKKVKDEAVSIFESAVHLQRMSAEVRKCNNIGTNFCFVGNPGTGKTTVARLFAHILHDCHLRKNSFCKEITAQEAKDMGPDKFRNIVNDSMDGVLFLDEAHDLDPLGDFKGKPIVNEILTLSENKRDHISVILAGYEDDFQKKLYAYNDGIKSRFHQIHFEDFDEDELTKIWTDMRKAKKWDEATGLSKVLVKRLLRSAGHKGFGNAREVRKQLEKATQAAMSRLGPKLSDKTMTLDIVDVIGENPHHNPKLKKVLDKIRSKVGWKMVKKTIEELVELCAENYERELAGEPPHEVFLNRMFLGNPGTGKTSCAKLYGEVLKHLSFLSNGECVVKTANDFKGQHIGESENRTNSILNSSRGKVLVIDEAYNLDDNWFGKNVLDTLVEKVQNSTTDDIAVLLLGYEEPMDKMIRSQNPGLARRFPKEYAFYFSDYTAAELLEILKKKIKEDNVSASVNFLQKANEILEIQREQANFGNAGAVELLLKAAIQKAASRKKSGSSTAVVGGYSIRLEVEDLIDPGSNKSIKSSNPLAALDGLFRMEQVKQKIEELQSTLLVAQSEGSELPSIGHFVFTGSPGTGKSTVCRCIAQILYGLGLIPSSNCIETTGLELTGEYLGQTKSKVNEKLKEAKGGILFIDEAYNLGFGPYGKEACDSIVAAMTSPEFKNVVIVIAGYSADINSMLNSNAGLKSRFTQFIEFPDWEVEDCTNFFLKEVDKQHLILCEASRDCLNKGFRQLRQLPGWGNGRDVKKLLEKSLRKRASRVILKPEELEKTLNLSDLQGALQEMYEDRQEPTASPMASFGWNYNKRPSSSMKADYKKQCYQGANTSDVSALDSINQSHDSHPSTRRAALDVIEEKTQSEKGDDGKHDIRDSGVSDDVWDRLAEAKRIVKELENQSSTYQKFMEEWNAEQQRKKEEYEANILWIQIQQEEEKKLEELQKAKELEERRKRLAEEKKKLKEREEHQRQVQMQHRKKMQERLQKIGKCPQGFNWYKYGSGWRCGGGSHYVTDAELKNNFCFDT